jgi:hypothetical protein
MNEINQLENRLRSWTPRRPSAGLKRRLFPIPAEAENDWPDPIGWRWLAPAMALCVAALIVLARSPHSGFGQQSVYRLAPTLALSNLDFATYYASVPTDHNLLQNTFEWTNGAHSLTTPPSVLGRPDDRE